MSRRMGLILVGALALSGCATDRRAASPGPAPEPCPFETCGGDAASLARLTADQLGIAQPLVQVAQLQSQFAGAVLVWRAHAGGKVYDCREGRNPRTGAVHYVDCRPSSDKADMAAFP